MKINQTNNRTENWATGEGDFEPGLKQASITTKENRRITINTPLTQCETSEKESTKNQNNPAMDEFETRNHKIQLNTLKFNVNSLKTEL